MSVDTGLTFARGALGARACLQFRLKATSLDVRELEKGGPDSGDCTRHLVGMRLPLPELKWPVPTGLQLTSPVTSAYVPGEHKVQTPLFPALP
jgi:hypothetical protein